jgi:hypothetical protein
VTVDYSALPRHVLPPGTRLYRIHRAHLEPWFFSSSGNGRFDPVLRPGRGACYWSEDPLGAWVEAFRTTMTIAEDDLQARALTTVELDQEVSLVDLTERRALSAGVTAAMTAGAGYTAPQELASNVDNTDDGIRWRVRHDLEQQLVAVALLGPAGSQPSANWPPIETTPVPDSLVHAARSEFGYKVSPTP